jgi:hypothetical protein
VQVVERHERERLPLGRLVDEPAGKQRYQPERRADHCGRRGPRPQRTPLEPHDQPEEEERREREEVPLGERADEARGEDADLDDEPCGQRDRDGEVGAKCGRSLASAQEQQRDGARGDDARDEQDVGEVVEDVPCRVACDVGDLARRAVRAEHVRSPPDARRELPRGPRGGEEGEPAEREDVPQGRARPLAVEEQLQRKGRHVGGDEDERLQPGQRGQHDRRDGEQLVGHGGSLERARHCPGREHENRVERDLGHQLARVNESRHGERQRGRGEGPPAGDEAPPPEVHRDRRQRHQDRLEPLQQRVIETQQPAGEGGIDERVEARRLAEDPEVPRVPEAAAELGVDRLVAEDPGRRHARGQEPAYGGREQHQPGERDPRRAYADQRDSGGGRPDRRRVSEVGHARSSQL